VYVTHYSSFQLFGALLRCPISVASTHKRQRLLPTMIFLRNLNAIIAEKIPV
jgi:hypothetical protein